MMSFVAFRQNKNVRLVQVQDIVPNAKMGKLFREKMEGFRNLSSGGGQIYYYQSSNADWKRGMGSSGYVLVRNEMVVDSLVLKIN